MKQYRIEYCLKNHTMAQILDFRSYEEAIQYVKNEHSTGFHNFLDGSVVVIPSDKIEYYNIMDNEEYRRLIDEQSDLPFWNSNDKKINIK